MSLFQLKQDIASCLAAFTALLVYIRNLRKSESEHGKINLDINGDPHDESSSIGWKLLLVAMLTELIAAIAFVIFVHVLVKLLGCAKCCTQSEETQERKYVIGHTTIGTILHLFFRFASFTYSPDTCKLPGISKMLVTVFYKLTVSLFIIFFWPWLFGLSYAGGYIGAINTAFATLTDMATTIVAESVNKVTHKIATKVTKTTNVATKGIADVEAVIGVVNVMSKS